MALYFFLYLLLLCRRWEYTGRRVHNSGSESGKGVRSRPAISIEAREELGRAGIQSQESDFREDTHNFPC